MAKTFVLVHGAWHGGWCYARVAAQLRAAGHTVFTPTLTGLGERAHLFSGAINLDTHIDDVLGVIRWEQLSDVVLVGHSYGGLVITGVADRAPDKIASLVYLDAFVPDDNQSLHDLTGDDRRRAQWEGVANNGGFAIPPIPAAAFGVNAADSAMVDRLCTPQPVATCSQRLRLTGGIERIKRKVYVLATGKVGGNRFRPTFEPIANDPTWITAELDCGHDVMVDLPNETAALLMQHG